MNQDLSLTLHNINPNSWIIRAFQNLCMNPSYCTELDYNKGTMVIKVDTLSNAGRELTDKLIEQFPAYFGDSCNINRVGNGITMVTSDMAGIALTFADSDLGLYITYMETLCYAWVREGVGPPLLLHLLSIFSVDLPTQVFFIYELIRPYRTQRVYHLVPYIDPNLWLT